MKRISLGIVLQRTSHREDSSSKAMAKEHDTRQTLSYTKLRLKEKFKLELG